MLRPWPPHPRRNLVAGLLAVACGTVAAGSSHAAAFEVDRAHLTVYFAVSHFDISYVRGRFTKITASVEFDQAARSGTVAATVDPGSIDTGNQVLDGVLRSPQYLDAGQYPEIRFVSDRFVFEGEVLAAVDGRLWLHGVQRPVRLVAERFTCREVPAGIVRRHVCGGAFRVVLKRSDFGMTGFLSDVGDEVQLAIGIEATRP